jgi:hypothetical protein
VAPWRGLRLGSCTAAAAAEVVQPGQRMGRQGTVMAAGATAEIRAAAAEARAGTCLARRRRSWPLWIGSIKRDI